MDKLIKTVDVDFKRVNDVPAPFQKVVRVFNSRPGTIAVQLRSHTSLRQGFTTKAAPHNFYAHGDLTREQAHELIDALKAALVEGV